MPRPVPPALLGAVALVALAGCAGMPTGATQQPAPSVQRELVAHADGFHVVRMQGQGWLGCTALRPHDAPGAGGEGAHVGLVRFASGQQALTLGGTGPGLSLGTRRRVPVTIDVDGSQDAGSGLLDQQYFHALTSPDQVAPLRAGATARLRFDGGFIAERRFSPGVIEAVSRCFSQTLAAAGLAPGGASARVPVARGGGAKLPPGALTPDVAGVSIE
jgi:hypothetical protein